MPADDMEVPQGRFVLRRPHGRERDPLRAWDAADELVLDHLHQLTGLGDRWLIVGDAFGALSVALTHDGSLRPQVWVDSHVSRSAIAANLELDGGSLDRIEMLTGSQEPRGPLDLVVVRIPRSIAELDDRLRRIRPLVGPGTVVVGAGMTRHIHTSTLQVFESVIGPTTTSLARRKARLIHSQLDPALAPGPPPEPQRWTTPDGLVVTARAGVHSSTGVDPGTALLLRTIDDPRAGSVVVDLGCGSGVVAATLVTRQPDIDVICCDDSDVAVASAAETVGAVTDRVELHVTDVLDGIADRCADLVVVNPPFHAGGASTTSVAEQMFAESARVLRSPGSIVVVGNRHLGYHRTLGRWFDSVRVIGSDPRFVVLRADRR